MDWSISKQHFWRLKFEIFVGKERLKVGLNPPGFAAQDLPTWGNKRIFEIFIIFYNLTEEKEKENFTDLQLNNFDSGSLQFHIFLAKPLCIL
jgi:hypothetical protein